MMGVISWTCSGDVTLDEGLSSEGLWWPMWFFFGGVDDIRDGKRRNRGPYGVRVVFTSTSRNIPKFMYDILRICFCMINLCGGGFTTCYLTWHFSPWLSLFLKRNFSPDQNLGENPTRTFTWKPIVFRVCVFYCRTNNDHFPLPSVMGDLVLLQPKCPNPGSGRTSSTVFMSCFLLW